MIPDEIERRLSLIQDDVRYLRTQIDHIKDNINGIIWKVVGLGAGSGALGFVVALIFRNMI